MEWITENSNETYCIYLTAGIQLCHDFKYHLNIQRDPGNKTGAQHLYDTNHTNELNVCIHDVNDDMISFAVFHWCLHKS